MGVSRSSDWFWRLLFRQNPTILQQTPIGIESKGNRIQGNPKNSDKIVGIICIFFRISPTYLIIFRVGSFIFRQNSNRNLANLMKNYFFMKIIPIGSGRNWNDEVIPSESKFLSSLIKIRLNYIEIQRNAIAHCQISIFSYSNKLSINDSDRLTIQTDHEGLRRIPIDWNSIFLGREIFIWIFRFFPNFIRVMSLNEVGIYWSSFWIPLELVGSVHRS
jgi:hypothetical protein